jgi:Ser/Thr protein kinase RdoA (MazF antagonist)
MYASLRDEERNLHWLFLEDVGGWKLEWCETEEWPVAFRWMARMHAETSGMERELLHLGCLDEHGPDFHCDLMDSARRSLRKNGEPDALVRFDALVGRYFGGTVSHLARRPRTLVHGDASCHNLMVEGGEIRPVDWEWAAVGHPAWDVAKLLSGWGSEREGLLEVYLGEFERYAALDREEFRVSLEHCRVLHAMWYLRWWIEACEDPAFVYRLLDKMERIWERADA